MRRHGIAIAMFRLFSLLLPRTFRERSGADAESLFVWQCERRPGGWSRLVFVSGALADVVRHALALRLGRRGGSPGRESRGGYRVGWFVQAGRIALRGLVRQPSFTLPVVATLGLGIGMATAMVSVVHGVLLRPLPYPDDDRLVVVRERTESGGLYPASYLNFADWRSGTSAFAGLSAVVGPQNTIVLGGAAAVRVPALFVSADYFRVAGVEPEIGRLLDVDENRPGAPPAIVVSHRFWVETLGAARDLGGVSLAIQDLFLRTESYQVAGVLPESFDLAGRAAVYLPLDRAVPWNVRGNHVVRVVGRLADAATIESATRELDRLQSSIHDQPGSQTEAIGVGMTSLREEVTGSVRTLVLLLLIGAMLLLATAFLNVSGAMLARGVVRQKEFGVRSSLGATRTRLLVQLTMESASFAIAGLVLGLLIAKLLLDLLSAMAPATIPRLGDLQATWPGLVLAASLLVGTGMLLFGVATAAMSTRGHSSAMRVRGQGTTRGARTVWRALVAIEVALALMLLATAAVLGRSLLGIFTADTGFSSHGVLTVDVSLPPRPGTDGDAIGRYFDAALGAVRLLPGVQSAGLANMLPLPGGGTVAGPVRLDNGETPDVLVQYRVVDGAFFETLGIRLIRGRVFDDRDVGGAPHTAVINTTMAAQLFGDADPIGRRFHVGGMDPYDEWLTVVGVVAEARPWTVAPMSWPVHYVDYRQRPVFIAATGASIVAHVRDVAIAGAIRDRVAVIDADVPVRVQSLDSRLAARTADRRFVLTLLAAFALLALVLTAVGIWGVVSFVASRRTRDIGIRLALGASPASVLRGLQWETGPPVLVGIAAGCMLAGALTRLVRAQLYGVGIIDPLSLGAVALTLAVTAWCASYLPARHARRLDPVRTMRDD